MEARGFMPYDTPFDWACPFCGRDTTITQARYSRDTHWLERQPANGLVLVSHLVTCPSRDCRRITVEVDLLESPARNSVGSPIASWRLVPSSDAKVFPDYVPQAIRDTYTEACLIRDLSAQASATLSRRCLQGMIRDFWLVKGLPTLKTETDSIKNNVEPDTWAAIEAVRSLGNIGAHMERDIDLIIEVDPGEAGLLIWLVERLIADWYIAREHRQTALRELAALKNAKDAAKRAATP